MSQVVTTRKVTLLELLEKLLDEGVVVSGDLILSCANVDLVYLDLKLLLSSVETLLETSNLKVNDQFRLRPQRQVLKDRTTNELSRASDLLSSGPDKAKELSQISESNDDISEEALQRSNNGALRIEANPNKTEKGLAKLVLTIVELLRRLMEHEAMRRIMGNTLSEEQVIAMGDTFENLDQRMKDMLDVFGLKEEDLNIDLGPLGKLI
ncbi:gas vesicle protein K [Desulfosporosinus sp. SYSU MS00001]|uniref:gas vesicle protein K n=1 Tax=Desulfosporosinus sp. SYSU MS00001 TaxID=3416284 RepID=UPI003CF7C2A6